MTGNNNNGKGQHGGGGKPSSPKQIDIVVIVNGSPETIKIKLDQPLLLLLKKALEETENTGQPVENWELRSSEGVELDLGQDVGTAGLKDGDVLSANLKTGAAG